MALTSTMTGPVAQVFILKQLSLCSNKSSELSRLQKRIIEDIINGKGNLERDLSEEKNKNRSFYNELLRKAVLSRNNYTVLHVLQGMHAIVGSSGDIGGDQIENIESAAYVIHTIHLATVKNDFKTLEVILEWAEQQNLIDTILNSKMVRKKECPLQVAILQQFDECVQILNKFGFEIELHPEDKTSIDNMIQASIHGEDKSTFLKYCFKSEHFFKHHSQKGLQEQDAIDRYLKFRAFSTPCYIAAAFDNYVSKNKADLNKATWDQDKALKREIRALDPMRKLFICAKRALDLSSYFVQHREDYQEIASNCNLYAKSLLEQCDDLSQVRCLLQCDEDQVSLTRVWEIALMEKNTTFVSHHYFQQIMYHKFCGEEMDDMDQLDWNNFVMLRKVSHYFFTSFMCLFYPIIIFLDIFRGGSILFESPNIYKQNKKMMIESIEEHQEENENFAENEKVQIRKKCDCSEDCCLSENYIFRKFRNNLHRPISRMIVDCYLEFFFLLTVILTILDPNDKKGVKDLQWYDIYSHFCFLSYLINNIIEIGIWGTNYFSHFWKVYSLVNSLLFVFGVIVRVYGFMTIEHDNRYILSGNHYVNVGTTFYALATIMVILQSARWLLRFRQTGPMVLCIIQVLKDVAVIVVLFVIIIVAFIFGLWFLYNIYDEEKLASRHENFTHQSTYMVKNQDYTQLRKVVSTLFWSVFSLPSINDAMVKHVNQTNEKDEPLETISYEFSHIITIWLLAAYQGTCVFILLNILIALMNTTYAKISQDADSMWKCSKAFLEYSFLAPRSAVPVPFRYLYYLTKLVYYQSSGFHCARPQKKSGNENMDYFLLSWELIKEERLSRMENAEEDHFEDLKKDLMNYIDNQVVKRLDNLEKNANSKI